MRRQRRGIRSLALIIGISLVAAACGGDDDDEGAEGDAVDEAAEGVQGGEIVDLFSFAQGPQDHIDPGINTTSSGWQIGGSLYDGLTEVDFSDPDNPQIVGVVAESWESNEDGSVWTFRIRDGLTFSDGEAVLPSSFERAWERASDPAFAGDYSYLFSFIEGGQEKLDGAADSIAGIEADDEAM
ncbi:MAG: ABC transporter substrate-binding protein, partial [Acidimicrobiales bacterium]